MYFMLFACENNISQLSREIIRDFTKIKDGGWTQKKNTRQVDILTNLGTT